MAGPCTSRDAADGELVPAGHPSRRRLSSRPATSTLAHSGLAFSLLVNTLRARKRTPQVDVSY
jgi:hypothetical protein